MLERLSAVAVKERFRRRPGFAVVLADRPIGPPDAGSQKREKPPVRQLNDRRFLAMRADAENVVVRREPSNDQVFRRRVVVDILEPHEFRRRFEFRMKLRRGVPSATDEVFSARAEPKRLLPNHPFGGNRRVGRVVRRSRLVDRLRFGPSFAAVVAENPDH